MTRFSSLEFDDAGKQPDRDDGEGIRNEAYFYKKAILNWDCAIIPGRWRLTICFLPAGRGRYEC
jgi:hypothetical protein